MLATGASERERLSGVPPIAAVIVQCSLWQLCAKSGRHALLHRGKRMLSSALQVRWHSVESAANELAKSQACCDDENGTLRRGVLGRARGVIAKA
jgi:hypothetical protein